MEYVEDQHVFEYLYAVLNDYMAIKNALLDSGIIKLQADYEPRINTRKQKIQDGLKSAFGFAVSPFYNSRKNAQIPPIDFVAQSFFAFSRSIDNVSNTLFSGNKVHLYDEKTAFPFGVKGKIRFYHDLIDRARWHFVYKGLMRVVPPDQQFSDERVAAFAELKSILRTEMCSTMTAILNKVLSEQK